MPQRIFSGFFDFIIFHRITGLCFFCTYLIYIENFFCAQVLLHLSMDFNQTFTQLLKSSAPAQFVGVFRFHHFSRNYGPLFLVNIYWTKVKKLTSHFGKVQEKNLKINFSDNIQFYFSIYFKSFGNMPDPVTYRRQRKIFRFCRSIKKFSV